MSNPSGKTNTKSSLVQLFVSFVIPIIILTKFSDSSQLGATRALLLALAFPVAYEIYSVYRTKKLSYLSVLAVGGILVTGGISLLGLSEEWLAIRRAVPYLAVALALLISILIKRPVLPLILPLIIDMENVNKRVSKNKAKVRLGLVIKRAGYLLSFVLGIVAIASYVLTKLIIKSQTNTSGFNQEYAELRLLTLPIIILPLVIAITLILFYLVTALEKLTGLEFEKLLKKK